MSAVALNSPGSSFTDRIFELLDIVDFRRADSEEDREAIFRLRYSAYVAEGAITPSFEKRFTDPYDDLGNAWIFGVYIGEKLVSSIRINVATRDFPDLPSLSVFPEYLLPDLEAGKILVDPTRHAVDRDAAAEHPGLVYMTMRLGWVAAVYFNADVLLAAVRTEHQAFYRRVGGHKVVCPARPYPLLDKPISLMTLDFHAGRARVEQRYPFFRSTNFERRMLFERLQSVPGVDSFRAERSPSLAAEPVRLVR
jgi:hypothetical protein